MHLETSVGFEVSFSYDGMFEEVISCSYSLCMFTVNCIDCL